MRLLADENFPFPALAMLRDRGYDVSWVADCHAGSSDELVAALCDREKRIRLTLISISETWSFGAVCHLGRLLSCFVSCRIHAWWLTEFTR